eukprot:270107_1
MGIKYLKTYLKDHPKLLHVAHFNIPNQSQSFQPGDLCQLIDLKVMADMNGKLCKIAGPFDIVEQRYPVLVLQINDIVGIKPCNLKLTSDTNSQPNVVVWDCLGWLKMLYESQSTNLLFDFKHFNDQCKQLIDTFKRSGFELIAFIDGYHCEDKIKEKRYRKLSKLKKIRNNLKIIKKMHYSDADDRQQLMKSLEFIPSSGYSDFLEQSLSYNGCKVYRGSSNNDIDKDIVQFAINNKEKVYGIMSADTDYFGFHALPKHVRIITEFYIENNELSTKTLKKLNYYYASELWNMLGLDTIEQQLQLICLCGNDFVQKRPINIILKICGFGSDQHAFDGDHVNLLGIIANAIRNNKLSEPVNIPDIVRDFYDANQSDSVLHENVNVKWMDIQNSNIFHGGFFFHDIDSVGFTIHQKLAPIRYSIIYKYLKLDYIKEYIPFYDDNDTETNYTVNVYKCQTINLKQMQFNKQDWNIQLLTKAKKSEHADLYSVYKTTLKILKQRKWIDLTQRNALELQFEIRFLFKKVHSTWDFYDKYCEFKTNGIPRNKDLTAQCLYWELSKLLCLNPVNILPHISELFDGPLFHYFCFEQSSGDKDGIMTELINKLNQYKQKFNNTKYNDIDRMFEKENNNNKPELNDIKMDDIKVFDSVKVPVKVMKRLLRNSAERIRYMKANSRCDVIQFLVKIETLNLKDKFNKQMINYLSKQYFNIPKHLPIIVLYGNSTSNKLAKDAVSNICKDVKIKKELKQYIVNMKEMKRKLEQYDRLFTDKNDDEKGHSGKQKKKKKKNITKKRKQKQTAINRFGYDQFNGRVYYAISLSKQESSKLSRRKAFKVDSYRNKSYKLSRTGFKLDYIKEHYDCNLWTYYKMDKIGKGHLKILKSQFGDNIAKELPVFLFFTSVEKAQNMKHA